MRKLDTPTYKTSHAARSHRLGPAKNYSCVGCSGPALHWSYDGLDPEEQKDEKTGSPFSLKDEHYQPRCYRCHVEYDTGLPFAEAQARRGAKAGRIGGTIMSVARRESYTRRRLLDPTEEF